MALDVDVATPRPRIACMGLGWIGCHRMEAVAADGSAEVVALLDPNTEAVGNARRHAPDARLARSFSELLDMGVDGLMIATPSALHASQARAALDAGLAVFCQKPLARTHEETRDVIAAARGANRLLGVDFSYRHVRAMQAVENLVRSGELGEVYAVDLVFHNAYGPDKDWFYDVQRSGGGCVIDLGIHLVDLALWCLNWPDIDDVSSRLYAGGRLLERDQQGVVEDYAEVTISFAQGTTARMTCSWNLHAGQDAMIGATFYGTSASANFRNVAGSFYDFVAEKLECTTRTCLVEPPDAWGGRGAVDWARRLARSNVYDPEIERVLTVAALIDQIYGRG